MWSNYLANFNEIKQSAAELMKIQQNCAGIMSAVTLTFDPLTRYGHET